MLMMHDRTDDCVLDSDLSTIRSSEVPVRTAITLLLVVACLTAAAAKLLAHPRMQASAAHLGIPWSRYRLVGVAELTAAVGVLAGLAVPALGVAAALGMTVLLVIAVAVHRRAGDSPREAAPALMSLGLSVGYLALALSS